MNILTAIIFLVLLAYYIYFLTTVLNGLKKLSSPLNGKIYDGFISVIIPFRNESEKILKNIVSMENLDYPQDKFEVIYRMIHSG